MRVLSNYTRLLTTFVLGVLLVRLLLRFGDDVYGLIALLGAGTGVAAMITEVVRAAIVPELGLAYHSRDRQRFLTTYHSACLLCLAAGIASLGAFSLLAWGAQWMQAPAALLGPARVFILCKAAQTFVVVGLAAPFNMYLLTERMFLYNALQVLERLTQVVAAVAIIVWCDAHEHARAVIGYGALSAALEAGVVLGAVALAAALEPVFWPSLRHVRGRAMASLLRSFGWNAAVVMSMNMYTRLDMFIMNAAFGLFGNLVFGVASQLTFYIRQLAMGLVTGIDAVSARLACDSQKHAGGGSSGGAVRRVIDQSTRLQALVLFPTTLGLIVFAEPLIQAWIGARLADPAASIPVIATLSRILLLGILARSLSEGWMRVLAGMGKVSSYAPPILLGAAFNPAAAGLLLVLLPRDWSIHGPALAFSGLLTLIHLMVLPRFVARELEISIAAVYQPMLRPLAAVAIWALCLTPTLWIERWDGATTVLVLAAAGALYAVLAGMIVSSREERRQFGRRLAARFRRGDNSASMRASRAAPANATPRTEPASPRTLAAAPTAAAPTAEAPAAAARDDAVIATQPARPIASVPRARSTSLSNLRHWGRRLALDGLAFASDFRGEFTRVRARPVVQVLLLHDVPAAEEKRFRRLLETLRASYTCVSYSEAARRAREGSIDRPLLAVSFDDGLKSCLGAARVLNDLEMRACFFVCPPLLSASPAEAARFCRDRLWIPPAEFLTWRDAEQLIAWGHEIGNHTLGHVVLRETPLAALRDELGASREALRRALGQGGHFAWPYGRFHHVDAASIRAVFETGHDTCASGERGCHGPHSESLEVPLCLRRDNCEVGWPLAHARYFLSRAARRPLSPGQTWPEGFFSAGLAPPDRKAPPTAEPGAAGRAA